MISNYGGLPVHTITAYVPTADLETAKLIMRQIRWIVKALILQKDPNSRIIVMGDFNLISIEKIKFLEHFGLSQVVPDE